MSNLAENITLETKIKIPREWLVDTLLVAMHFAAKQDVRYYLTGVCVHFQLTGIALIATDGHRLFYNFCPCFIPKNLVDTQYILSLDSLKQLKALPKLTKFQKGLGPDLPCTFEVPAPDSRFMTLTDHNEANYQFETIDGKFPDYNRVMWTEELEDPRSSIKHLKERALVKNAGKEEILDLVQRLPSNIADNTIGLNLAYLADLAKLKPITNKYNGGKFQLKSATDSIRITALNHLSSTDIIVYVMPMRL